MSSDQPAKTRVRRRRDSGPNLPVMWQESASCRGSQAALFFPPAVAEAPEDKSRRESRAKSHCGVCSVRMDCLDYALIRGEDFGIWGGLNELERRLLSARSS